MLTLLRGLLLAVVLVIGLGALGLGLAHFRPGAGDNAATVTIAAPPDAVFAALTDMQALPRWVPGMLPPDNLSGGPLRVGSRYRLTVKESSGTTVMELNVIALEP